MNNSRKTQILSLLNATGFVNVQELSKRFGVSLETVRRDLMSLEADGLIRKIHGGAVAAAQRSTELEYQNRKTLLLEEKREIARLAASLIDDGDTIIITSGTTTLALTEFLLKKKNLTVITNSILLCEELANSPSITIYSLGGRVRNGNYSLSGALSMQNINVFNANKLILGVGGITPDRGLTDYQLDEAMLSKSCIECADCAIAVADHTKFGMVAEYKVCSVQKVKHLVTSTFTPYMLCEQYESAGMHVHTAQIGAAVPAENA